LEYLNHIGVTPQDLNFVSSPLIRTRQTMELVRTELGLAAEGAAQDDRLKEISFGKAEGLTLEEMKQKMPDVYHGRLADKWGFQMPEGESYAMVADRVKSWFETIKKPMLVVTHGGTSRVIRGKLMDLEFSEIPELETPQDKFYLWQNNLGAWL
jgi:probable phosphoglycerate mutase